MDKELNTFINRVSYGVKCGLSNKMVREVAKQFMKDNGYKLTETGKRVAIDELELLDDYPVELISAIGAAIATL